MKKLVTPLIGVILLLALASQGWSQSLDITQNDLSKIKVEDLTDSQVRRYIEQARQLNLSESEMEAQALSRGMSYDQIMALRERIASFREVETDERPGEELERTRHAEDERAVLPDFKTDVFGYELFRHVHLTFEPSLHLPVPKDYILGAGDQLLIHVWGASQSSYDVTITPGGYINLDNLGNIPLSGLSIKETSDLLTKRLSAIYSGLTGPSPNTFAHISLGEIRSIQVTIAGEAFLPGTYTLPSLATAFNALYAAGGPSLKGSFRDIRVIRNNEVVASVDLYDFLLGGDMSNNIRLQDQDLLFVSTYGNRVTMEGELKRPAIYELKDTETLEDVIGFAGSFNEKAYTSRLKIERITDTQKEVLNVTSDLFSSVQMRNGDKVLVEPVLDRFENLITIEGAVYRPGGYAHQEGMTLTSLLEIADGLRGDAFMHRASIYREEADYRTTMVAVDLQEIYDGRAIDPELQARDLISISSIFEMEEAFSIQIQGHIQQAGTVTYTKGITLGEVVRKAGGLRESASLSMVEVARRVANPAALAPGEQTAEIFTFPLSEDLALEDEAASFVLHPFDIIFVRRSPDYFTQQLVNISGEVAFPGSYTITRRGERISELIRRAGGLTADAYPEGAYLQRHTEQTGLDREGTRYVGVDFVSLIRSPGSREDLFLMEGDTIYIPQELQTVSVSGALQFPVTTRYRERMRLRHYVDEAGGFAENADRRRVYVRYPNGTSDRTRSFLFVRSYPEITPGTEVIVPSKPEREGRSAQEIMAISSSAASIVTMVIYIINAF